MFPTGDDARGSVHCILHGTAAWVPAQQQTDSRYDSCEWQGWQSGWYFTCWGWGWGWVCSAHGSCMLELTEVKHPAANMTFGNACKELPKPTCVGDAPVPQQLGHGHPPFIQGCRQHGCVAGEQLSPTNQDLHRLPRAQKLEAKNLPVTLLGWQPGSLLGGALWWVYCVVHSL